MQIVLLATLEVVLSLFLMASINGASPIVPILFVLGDLPLNPMLCNMERPSHKSKWKLDGGIEGSVSQLNI